MATVVIVGTMDMLLNASGVELSTRQDYDMDREMRNVGITNVVSGLSAANAAGMLERPLC